MFLYSICNAQTSLNSSRRFLFTQKLLISIKRRELNKYDGKRENMIFFAKMCCHSKRVFGRICFLFSNRALLLPSGRSYFHKHTIIYFLPSRCLHSKIRRTNFHRAFLFHQRITPFLYICFCGLVGDHGSGQPPNKISSIHAHLLKILCIIEQEMLIHIEQEGNFCCCLINKGIIYQGRSWKPSHNWDSRASEVRHKWVQIFGLKG